MSHRLLRLPSVLAGLLALSLAAAAHGQVIVRSLKLPAGGKTGVVLVSFYTGGHADKGGRGLAVVNESGQGVPFRILAHDPDGQTWLAIDARGAGKELALQYSPQPLPDAAVKRDDKLAPSLILQTFTFPKRDIKDGAELAKALANLPPRGTMQAKNIALSYNPFGANENFASVFEGVLKLSEPTKWRLVSTHQAAAFVEIDGKWVINNPQPNHVRDPEKLAVMATDVTLDKGEHRIRYLHVQTTGQPLAVLANVGEKSALPLAPTMFVHDEDAILGDAKVEKGGGVPAGFDAVQLEKIAHDVEAKFCLFVRYRFRPIAAVAAGGQYRWDFGDGTTLVQPATASTREVEHVFFVGPDNNSTWRVRLELQDKSGSHSPLDTAASSVSASTVASRTIQDQKLVTTFAEIINQTDYGKAAPELLTSLYELISTTEQPALIAPLAEVYVKRLRARPGRARGA